MSTIGIDFDGVIHSYSRGWADGSIYDDPAPGAWLAIQCIQQVHAVFIQTSRDALQVCRWMDEHSPFHTVMDPTDPKLRERFWDDRDRILVTNRKLPALAYIDDRAIRHQDWLLTQVQLEQLGLL